MKALRLLLLLAALWLAGIAIWIATVPEENDGASADVALVLGAAVDSDTPSPVFAARLDHAIALYKEGRVAKLMLTGGRSDEYSLSEAAAGREYAIARGVAADDILIDENSRTTRQNLLEAQRVMKGEGVETALVVSDPLHLRRAMQMAQSLGLEAQPSATPHTRYRSWQTKVPFLLREVYFVHHSWLFDQ
ncbi:YdcF family protein [Qipengyuania sp. 1NDH17]|uniref:YdcF family protein n=1 Tax=Qipengyuania polymorpha TaxID=2867234 RepID=A0ABS7IZA8_9SPHN|nr:YdcF family protein [Qipengyuania polymorpha]